MAQLSASGVTAINNVSAAVVRVIANNDTRTGITFHNPGQNTLVVFPTTVMVNGANVPLNPSTSALGGGFMLPSGATLFMGEPTCRQAWQALALSGAGNPLTVQEQT